MKFSEIRGQNRIKEHLQKAIAQKKTSHAYIINGEKESGKRMLADAFAATLLCEAGGADACCQCRSCKQIASGNNPDVIYVTHENKSLGIKDIREQLVGDIAIKPYAAEYKVYIVEDANLMTLEAQNALLKSIEEPPSYIVVLLLTTNADAFIPTILSRCVTLNMEQVSEQIIMNELMSNYGIPDYQAKVYASFAQGNLGKAVGIATSEDFKEVKDALVDLVSHIERMDILELNETAEALKPKEGSRGQVEEYLDLLHIWYRDVLLYKAMGSQEALVFKDLFPVVKAQASSLSYAGLNSIFEAIKDAEAKLRFNCNFVVTVELLLLKIKECYS